MGPVTDSGKEGKTPHLDLNTFYYLTIVSCDFRLHSGCVGLTTTLNETGHKSLPSSSKALDNHRGLCK